MTKEPLSHWRPWLEDIRKDKPYELSDDLEKLFHEKSISGRAAWNRLFDETIASLRFDIDGTEMTLEPVLSLMQDRDGAARKRAADALAKTLRGNLRTFTLITNTLSKDKEISDRWRGFEDVADSRHLSTVSSVKWSMRSCRRSSGLSASVASLLSAQGLLVRNRYTRLLGPQCAAAGCCRQNLCVDDARKTVLDAYGAFSPRMAGIAQDFFDRRWIDAPVRPGKAPGAFAHPTVPSAHPYVLLNYQGKPRDVMTLAHELGHGVHQVLAGPRGALMAPTPLTLAETASVFGEMLTFRALLDATTEKVARRALLASKVEDMINTVVRQIAFYSFERELHTARAEGELTTDRICDIWMGVQGDSLGPAIRLGPGYETFWSYIPHFIHSPFYVYAYAFGDCLVNSLYGVYRRSEKGFVDRYFAMLEAGGTKHHSELLAPFGLDAREPDFWAIGLQMIEDLIVELEALS